MRARYEPIYLVPAILALAGPAFLVAVTWGGFLPFALGWWALAFLVAQIRSPVARIGVGVVLLPVCVLLAFEGGLYMLPAVFTMLLIDATRALPAATARSRSLR